MAKTSENIENKILDLQKGKRECINMYTKGHLMTWLTFRDETPSCTRADQYLKSATDIRPSSCSFRPSGSGPHNLLRGNKSQMTHKQHENTHKSCDHQLTVKHRQKGETLAES